MRTQQLATIVPSLACLVAALTGGTAHAATETVVEQERAQLRFSAAYAITDVQLQDGYDFDDAYIVDGSLLFYRSLSTRGLGPGLLWGVGVAAYYETLDDDALEATYMGAQARYNLGFYYQFTRQWQVNALAYVGVGGMNLEAKTAIYDEGSFYWANSWGAQVRGAFEPNDHMQLSFGLGYAGLHGSHDFTTPAGDIHVSTRQNFATVDVGFGWTF